MNNLRWPRFQRLFLNDLQTQGRKILMGSAGALVVGVLLYLTVMSGPNGDVLLYRAFFIIAMYAGGLTLTSMIFSDMHHPDERYFYLMQPVSNFERILSRYLISGPLFHVYFVALYYVFEMVARVLSNLFFGQAAQFFDYRDSVIQGASRLYLVAHAVVLLGAIYFRSYALAKTILSLAGLVLACITVLWFSMRLVFWDYFPSLFAFAPANEPATSFHPANWPTYIHWFIAVALYLWVLFIAYTTLQDHEA